MRSKVTVQDIADALNLSRTTVSKVLNNSPSVSDATRIMVLEKAKELGYRVWAMPEAADEEKSSTEFKHFALVMHAIPGGNHMGTVVIPSMDQKLRQVGYSLITIAVSDEEYDTMSLPPILYNSQIKAIVCLEVFNPEYSRLLCTLGKPVLFVDACADFLQQGIDADLLLMESRYSTNDMLTSLIHKHKLKTMGFVGDSNHCFSFRERFEAFRQTALQEQIEYEPYSIIDDDAFYGDIDWLKQQLEAIKQLPELFFCANDFLAVATIHALEAMGKHVPEDVMVCGFDGMPSITWPLNQLTTIVTPTNQLGTYAAVIPLWKIKNSESARSVTYLKTDLLFRETAPL